MAITGTVVVIAALLVAALYVIVEAAIRVCSGDVCWAKLCVVDAEMRSYAMADFRCRMDKLHVIAKALQDWCDAHANMCFLEQSSRDEIEELLPVITPTVSATAFQALAARLVPYGEDSGASTSFDSLPNGVGKVKIVGAGVTITAGNGGVNVFYTEFDQGWDDDTSPDTEPGEDEERQEEDDEIVELCPADSDRGTGLRKRFTRDPAASCRPPSNLIRA